MSQKSTVKCRRSLGAPDVSTGRDDNSRLGGVGERCNSAGVSNLPPHSPQNLLWAGLVAPHRRHVIGNSDPHCVQKRLVCGLFALQLRHFIEAAWKLQLSPAIRHCAMQFVKFSTFCDFITIGWSRSPAQLSILRKCKPQYYLKSRRSEFRAGRG